MTSVADPRSESRNVIHRAWKTFLRSSANNMLTTPLPDELRANFANNSPHNVLRHSLSQNQRAHPHLFQVLRRESAAVANGIAALLLHLRDRTGQVSHAYFSWTECNP